MRNISNTQVFILTAKRLFNC